jgi:tRNA dimethylallyltransferase
MDKPLIVIGGATATGKTALALSIAARVDGEIIGADSRQLYRYMDIGTAKPTPDERAAARHHLIDVIDPDAACSAAEYQRAAISAIVDIQARGRIPLLVGGTGQYITALLEGWTMTEVAPDPALRAQLEAEIAANGLEALSARLRTLDPDAAAFLDFRNPRRVIRALEVCLLTGQPFSAQRRKTPPDYTTFSILLTRERASLYARADARFDQMIAAGFVDEVRSLLARGYSPDLPAMSAVGYREIAAHIQDGIALIDAVQAAKYATHAFIRRQMTWFRKSAAGFLWHNGDADDNAALIRRASAWVRAGG